MHARTHARTHTHTHQAWVCSCWQTYSFLLPSSMFNWHHALHTGVHKQESYVRIAKHQCVGMITIIESHRQSKTWHPPTLGRVDSTSPHMLYGCKTQPILSHCPTGFPPSLLCGYIPLVATNVFLLVPRQTLMSPVVSFSE